MKEYSSTLGVFFVVVCILALYHVPIVNNFTNKNLLYPLSKTGKELKYHLLTQVPQIISILLWEVIIFWLLSLLIYVIIKRPRNALKQLSLIVKKQNSTPQTLWSIAIFPFTFNGIGTYSKAIISILKVLFVIFAFVLLSPHFPGAGTPYFAGITAVASLIFTWSASAAIADFISGIILIFFADLEEGDWVKIGDVIGKIQEQNLLIHQIKTTKNTIVTIPNGNVLKNIITNYTPPRKRNGIDSPQIIYTTVTLGYDVDQEDAINALESAAKSTSDIITHEKVEGMQDDFIKINSSRTTLKKEQHQEIEKLYKRIIKSKGSGEKVIIFASSLLIEKGSCRLGSLLLQDYELKNTKESFEPFVLITSLDDFYVSYELNAYLNPSISLLNPGRIPKIYSELHQNIQQECLKEEIEILSPHYNAERDGNNPAVPVHSVDKFRQAQNKHKGKLQQSQEGYKNIRDMN